VSNPADQPDQPIQTGALGPDEGATPVLDAALEQAAIEAIAAGDADLVRDLIRPLHVSDVADLLEHLHSEARQQLVEILREGFNPEILTELDETVRDGIILQLGVADAAAAVAELDTDDAVHVMGEMDEADQQQILDAIPADDRTLIEAGLAYPEDSAGRMMQRELVSVPEFWTVGQTIDYLRDSAEAGDDTLPKDFYEIYVVDPTHKPLGEIPLSRLLRTKRGVSATDIMNPEMNLIPVAMDQEDLAFLFRQRDLVSAPVVDDSGRLVGTITIDDVVDVIDEEHEEDIMRMGGVTEDDLYSASLETTRARFTWLLLNLVTAVLASLVIGLFEATLDQMVALAILMPIVASMGGNAGTQTLTVSVRALAMKELTSINAMRVIGKELIVGGFNGILFAILTGVVVWVWFGSLALGGVIALAMIINMTVAGLAGTTIPILLERIGVDPAVASSVFLTTVTDVVGFFVFLALAGLFLL